VSVPKILLYYSFTPIDDPEAVRLWQRELCASLGLRGRILISRHGINGTVGGEIDACKQYLRKSHEHPAFKNLNEKWSDGTSFVEDAPQMLHGHDRRAPWRQISDFPRLSVKVRDEIVSFGAPKELVVDVDGVVGGGTHLTPAQVNELVHERGDDVVFFDGRNAVEAEIGRFKGAIVPDVTTTHDFIRELESGKYDHLKDKPIVTYCTGGIRCEVLSPLMKSRGFNEVYQIDGGIVKYGEAFGNDGLWEGSLYVFDARNSVDFAQGAKVIGTCVVCGESSNVLVNCQDASCRVQRVACEQHGDAVFCAEHETTSVRSAS
jgi:UPF0176 protein